MATLRNKLRVLLREEYRANPKGYKKPRLLDCILIHLGKRNLCFQSLGEN